MKKQKSDKAMAAGTPCDYSFKLLIIGESGVGKTSILLRFTDDYFSDKFMSTIGVDFKVKELEVDGKHVKLQIWDSAGQERFRNITMSYYRNSSGIIIVYDVTNHTSFDHVNNWIEEVRKYVPGSPLMLVGNKADLEDERKVQFEEGQELAEKHNLIFLETSAKTALNIEDTFEKFTRILVQDAANKPKHDNKKALKLEDQAGGKKKKKCCA